MQLRPPAAHDASAVLDVILAREQADRGRAESTLADLQEEWSLGGFQLAADAVVCEQAGGEVVGYAAVLRSHSVALVAPTYEGKGVGGALLSWIEARECALGRTHHRQGVASTNKRGEHLLLSHGYRHERSYLRMVRKLDDAPSETPHPHVSLRELDTACDVLPVYALDADSFADSPDYIPMSFAAFCDEHLHTHDLAPELSAVAEHEGELIGFLLTRRRREQLVGFIDVLAVSPRHQRRGIGTALLERAFARFHRAGLSQAQLGVASSNPLAMALYERLGMRPVYSIDAFERPVSPA